MNTTLFQRKLSEKGVIIATKLKVGAARIFLGNTSISCLTNKMLPLAHIFKGDSPAIEASIFNHSDLQQRVQNLASWLSDLQQAPFDPKIELTQKIAADIAKTPEISSAAQLASHYAMPLRALQRLFRDYLGASPKWVIRRYRLQEAAVALEMGHISSLTTLAMDLGYSDQAHFSRDFKSAVGCKPSGFNKKVWT
ncbi:MAG: helix-turn-helix transcriptional regulator [Paracoccaceae bacterium]